MPVNNNEHPASDRLVVAIPDVVERMANDPEAIGRNAVRLAEKHDRISEPPENERRTG